MTDRTVSVRLQAQISDYMAKFSAASKATSDFANKVDVAKGRAAQGYHAIGIAGVAVGAAVAGGFALAIKASADFDAKMALVRTLAHATAGEMSQLRDAALHVGQAYGFSATQVADAEAELVKAGVSVKDMMGGALVGALTLASAGQTDVATATTIAATAMTQFQLKGKDVPHIADLLAAGADKALGSVVDLGYALDQAGPQAHQFHVSLEETVGTLAAFAQAGQIGERGGTIFTQMLLKLAAPGKQSSDILKQLGINIYGTNGQFVGMANLAGQLQTKMAGLTEAERNHDLAVVFGQRAIRGANILYQDGAKGIQEWTNKVNAAGFAQLQASGKLNSLSGDVTKLKTALQTAFIGVGEGSQGPLRGVTQDVTGLVNAWNGLPGPVRVSAEALIAVTGATALAGGAALLFIPKWTAMNAALAETRFGAVSARGAMLGLGKGLGVATAVVALYEGAKFLGHVLQDDTTPSVNQFTSALIDLQRNTGGSTAQLDTYIATLGRMAHGDAATFLPGMVKNLDAALAGLVTGGHLSTATEDFSNISRVLRGAGMTTKQITALFPQFALELSNSATSAKVAGNGVDQYGNAVTAAAKATKTATDAAKAYSDRLHALTDPLFAMNQALQDLTAKQHAAAAATRRYGADSHQARQANLDLASSSLDVETAARTLTAAVTDGSVSLGDARRMLRGWVQDGLVTRQQAILIAQSFHGIINEANRLAPIGRRAGHAVGVDFGAGLVAGLNSQDGAVRQAAQLLSAQITKQARLAINAHSPSRDAIALGHDFGTGLAIGLDQSRSAVETAALSLGNSIVSTARSTLSGDRQARGQMVSGISSSLLGGLDLSGAYVNGRVGNLSAYLSNGTRPLATLHREEATLRKRGLDPDLLAQIAGADPVAGAAIAQSILSGRSGSIAHLDALELRARHLAKATGQIVGGATYDRQIAADLRRLGDGVDVLHRIETILRANPKATGHELAVALDSAISGAQHKQHSKAGR